MNGRSRGASSDAASSPGASGRPSSGSQKRSTVPSAPRSQPSVSKPTGSTRRRRTSAATVGTISAAKANSVQYDSTARSSAPGTRPAKVTVAAAKADRLPTTSARRTPPRPTASRSA